MPYKFPNLPSPQAYKEEIADFWEIEAIRNPETYVSLPQIANSLSIGLDEIRQEGIHGEEEELTASLDGVYNELRDRILSTNNKYPFIFEKYSIQILTEDSFYKKIYVFLLLCTRFNMNKLKVQKGIDGTLLFERLCNYAAKKFFGLNANSIVFGTSESGSFKDKVADLIKNIGEGGAFKDSDNSASSKNDDGVDLVVWKEFSDKRIGKLIGFGQCKTGTSWVDTIKKLNPQKFCNCWMQDAPVLNPIPLVFICDTMFAQHNFYHTQSGFLIFNRFRILEYIDADLDESIKKDIDTWVSGALVHCSVM